ncbi:MAG TPA: glycoside hydrolase family 32 protein [Terriglobia bacterium]|nr:glycoside hydrolase family 32 protein [Terriglobia bacterium]
MPTHVRKTNAATRRQQPTAAFILFAFLPVVVIWASSPFVADGLYDEPFRPQFHFTPARNWTNDPNGPVYYKGEYHLFYQYNPFGDEWGHMSWGHAVSRDLLHWQHLPVAIPEENGVMIFSGSTVVDLNNSSGLCKSSSATDHSCLIAVYTGYTGKEQNQNLAYSNDRGRTWSKYSGNPVIDLHLKDFRDPKVFWDEPRHRWVMVTALSPQHKLRFFGSTDLKHWTALSDFGPAGAVGGAWECPDLFQLPVEGQPGETRWVLSVNVNPGGVAGGSGDQYFVGQFDGTRFANGNSASQTLWADYGRDFYASTSFSDIPRSDGRRIWMGWLNNWDYAAHVPTSPWRGQQSIPRALKLHRTPQGIRLVQEPVIELQALRERHVTVTNQSSEAANAILQSKKVNGDTLEIEAEIDPEQAAEFGIKVRKGPSEETVIGVDRAKSVLFVDRTRSGDISFDPKFPGRQEAPLNRAGEKAIALHIFVDRCSVEVFANDGEVVVSDLVFPSSNSRAIELYSKVGKARIESLDVWNLKSIWSK